MATGTEKTLDISVKTEAKLVLVYDDPKTGQRVEAEPTKDQLRALDLQDQDTMYRATMKNLAALGIDVESEIGSQLRYLIEQSTHYANLGGVEDHCDEGTFDELAALLRTPQVLTEGRITGLKGINDEHGPFMTIDGILADLGEKENGDDSSQ